VLVYDPKLLILDEPTSNLPPREISNLTEILEDERKRGKAILVTSHDIEFVAEVADRVYVLYNGRIIANGKCREILSSEKLLKAADLKPPYSVEISTKLDLDLSKPPITVDELIEILKYLRNPVKVNAT